MVLFHDHIYQKLSVSLYIALNVIPSYIEFPEVDSREGLKKSLIGKTPAPPPPTHGLAWALECIQHLYPCE